MDKRKPTNPPPKPDKGALPEKVGGNPAPEERADFVVRRLEQFIRDGRTMAEGMLSKWQEMAQVEIANAIVESEVAIGRSSDETAPLYRRLRIQHPRLLGRALGLRKSRLSDFGFRLRLVGIYHACHRSGMANSQAI